MPAANLEHIRHSLAHLLAAAVLEKFPKAKLGIGPTIEHGFYYDFLLPRSLTPDDLREFEAVMRELIKQALPFSGKKVAPATARKDFKEQPFKLDLIKEFVKEGRQLTEYRTGDRFLDLCRGGHVENTKEIDPAAFRLTHTAAAYWRGDEANPQLQRIYGVAFTTKKELDDHLTLQKEIERRDHRKLGERLDLFSFHAVAPGATFWHGKGMVIWRELEKFMREKLDREGYDEVSTPIMVKQSLFERSGHWQYYREHMFYFNPADEPKQTYVLKPMNCPESTLIYATKIRSYKDLPIRLSEITDRLYRNERSGTLGGLLRVQLMTQDDAHIYCRPDQIGDEITKLLWLINEVYAVFTFPMSFSLATRPDKALGDPKLWQKAERALEAALKAAKVKYELKPKDGAFYGPKIDINVRDALKREWTIATIQLDFQMPERFNLAYIDEHGKKQTPVMIHRAILGSFERFIGILLEHTAGALPVWLSPTQVKVIPVGQAHRAYAAKVLRELSAHGVRTETSPEHETVGKAIREGELQKIPYLLVVGDREVQAKTVAVRERGTKDTRTVSLATFAADLQRRIADRSR